MEKEREPDEGETVVDVMQRDRRESQAGEIVVQKVLFSKLPAGSARLT